jgi:hypothetical protein
LPKPVFKRGSIFEEAIIQDYSDGGTSSFYSLLTLNTFSNTEIHCDINQFDTLRKLYLKSLRRSITETFWSPNVDFATIFLGLRASGLSWSDLVGSELFSNWRQIRLLFPFLRGWKLKRKKFSKSLMSTQLFLEQLQSKYVYEMSQT